MRGFRIDASVLATKSAWFDVVRARQHALSSVHSINIDSPSISFKRTTRQALKDLVILIIVCINVNPLPLIVKIADLLVVHDYSVATATSIGAR